ncbi:MAG: lysophospholipid acyltransferase family protein [Acidobacteria bacterium]|nr:lysophospholipid acyltransferase family protein [Acidobacteriota bacterium]
MARRRKSRSLILLEYGAFRVVRWIVGLIGRGGTQRIADALARILPSVARSRTRTARANLRLCFPERTDEMIEQTIRACWRHFARQSLQYLRSLDRPTIEKTGIRVHGREALDRAIGEGRGVVLFTAHFGDWESAIAALETLDIPFAVVARPLDNPLLQRDIERARTRTGIRILARRKSARTMRDWIAQGKGVVVLPDQAVAPRHGLLVPFVSQPAWTTPAPAKLAIRNGAAIIGAFCYPSDDEGLEIELTELRETRDMTGTPEEIEEITQWINELISTHIRREPHLWLWMHERWKRSPSDPRYQTVSRP